MKPKLYRVATALRIAILVLSTVVLWRMARPIPISAASGGLIEHVMDVPMPGAAVRFDYQSFDPKSGLLYISHMDDDHVVVFDTRHDRVVANVPGCPGSTGVLFVPEFNRVYSSASGAGEVVVIDAASWKIIGRVGGLRFPDGIAYAPDEKRLFVSDEAGSADVVIDARTDRKLETIRLGGEAGNTKYDPVSHRILVTVQTRNQVAAIDPKTMRIVGRYKLTAGEHPHGLYVEPKNGLAFIACEGDGKLLVADLSTMRVLETHPVGDGPDVLAFDPGWHRLYVASEGGSVSVFDEIGHGLQYAGEIRAPHAHTVAVDPGTHRVYLPLENINGHPVLRILRPVPPRG